MNKTILYVIAGAMIALATESSANAQLDKFLPFKKRVDTSKDANFELTDRQGPWLIMCASFSGERAEHQAHDLMLELRSKHNLNAFIYRHEFDYTKTYEGLGWERYKTITGEESHREPQMKAANPDHIQEIAVVVGDFASIDDAASQKTLQKVKHLRPRTIEVASHIDTDQKNAHYREFVRKGTRNKEMKEMGPMRAAFLMPNPKLDEEYFRQQTVDRFIINLNKGIKHSLLKCPGNYSVCVATFRGSVTSDSAEIQRAKKKHRGLLNLGKPVGDTALAQATEDAHLLTKALRKKGVQAYEFHDRNESYVCIGSFEWASRDMQNGQKQLNPDMVAVINRYKASVDNFPGMAGQLRPKTLPVLRGTGINFDIQPLPVAVPKISSGIGTRGKP